MSDLEERIIAVVATQQMKKPELRDYIAIEGWPDVDEAISSLFNDGTLELDGNNRVVLA